MPGLYIHIPFCLRKCDYCDFFSVEAAGHDLDGYAELLVAQLRQAAGDRWCGPFSSVYFGGGTPSLLRPATVDRLLTAADELCGLAGDAEISLEANPGTVDEQTLASYRAAGINRLSLGLQSCHPGHLATLGRLHDGEAGLAAVHAARAAGFTNLSLDLMFALPGQSLDQLDAEIDAYLELAPEHLSCYGLTVEEGTRLKRRVDAGELLLPDENFYADAFLRLDERLCAAGYEHYEIANYARAGCACRHNLGYWARRSYLGLGAGAHSFCARDWGSRWQVPTDMTRFDDDLGSGRSPLLLLERFGRDAALRETVYLALRTRNGVVDEVLRERFGSSFSERFAGLLEQGAHGLQHEAGRWFFRPAEWLLFDHLILPFL
jgi:oxygen-independent coproporphyrinogen-3 oxidase